MVCTVNASTSSSAIVSTADGSGILKIMSNGVTTNALAWAKINHLGSGALSIGAQYNISSVTYSATGIYSFSFTNASSDANYSIQALTSQTGVLTNSTSIPTTSGFSIQTINSSTSAAYVPISGAYSYVAIFGN